MSALLALGGCGDSIADPAFEMADTIHVEGPVPPVAAFDSGGVVLGRLLYAPCGAPFGGWRMNWLPEDDPLVLDLHYSNQPPDGPHGGILPDNFAEIEHADAESIEIGALGMVRIRVRRESLVWLTPHLGYAVPDQSRMDTGVTLGYTDPSVRELFESLGGVTVHDLAWISAIGGVVPNEAIPELEVHPGVDYVHHDGLLCPIR